jgi:hypothetical protein
MQTTWFRHIQIGLQLYKCATSSSFLAKDSGAPKELAFICSTFGTMQSCYSYSKPGERVGLRLRQTEHIRGHQ